MVSLDPQIALGEKALDARDLSRALEIFLPLSQHSPDDPRVLLGLGKCKLACGDLDHARQLFERFLIAAKDNEEVAELLFLIEAALGRPENCHALLPQVKSIEFRDTYKPLLRALEVVPATIFFLPMKLLVQIITGKFPGVLPMALAVMLLMPGKVAYRAAANALRMSRRRTRLA